MAELTVALLFALARSIPAGDQALRAGLWQRFKGVELPGKTLGLVDCGKIGRLVAEMATGLGMNVIAYGVFIDPSFRPLGRFRFGPFEEIIRSADAISLHCPRRRTASR